MDASLQLILAGILVVVVSELYRPWNRPNPYERSDTAKFWGFESWRWTAIAMSYVRLLGIGAVAFGLVVGLIRLVFWLLS